MKRIVTFIIFMGVSLGLVFFMIACTDENITGSTINEPEITVEYLSSDYAQQLIRDGAIYVIGTIEIIVDENGNPFIIVAEKEIVEDPSFSKGYYIADKNLTHRYPLSFEARTTHLSGSTSIANVMDSESFVKAVESDIMLYGQSNPEYARERLYDIFIIGDQIELILAKYI